MKRMQTTEMLVAPAQAIKWLEGNVHNRVVRSSVVERYARDMKAGKWRLTHQGIAFDENDTLVDGQHRLYAIMEADVAVRLMVTFGVPMEAQAVIDDSLPRTMVDVLKITYNQTDASNLMVAIAKRIVQPGMTMTIGKMTRQEQVDAMQRYAEPIRFAQQAFPRKVRGVTTAAVMTVIARAWFTQKREQLLRFAVILADGRIADDREEAALTLRNWLLEKAQRLGTGPTNRNDVIYATTERGLVAFLRGETIGILRPVSVEQFPLPGTGRTDKNVAPPKRRGRPAGSTTAGRIHEVATAT